MDADDDDGGFGLFHLPPAPPRRSRFTPRPAVFAVGTALILVGGALIAVERPEGSGNRPAVSLAALPGTGPARRSGLNTTARAVPTPPPATPSSAGGVPSGPAQGLRTGPVAPSGLPTSAPGSIGSVPQSTDSPPAVVVTRVVTESPSGTAIHQPRSPGAPSPTTAPRSPRSPIPPTTPSGPPPAPATVDLAHGRPATATSQFSDYYGAANITGGDTSRYWEGASNAFPQTVTVDLGSATRVARLVMALPPVDVWGSRRQTIGISGSPSGPGSATTILSPRSYTFDANDGSHDTVTVTFAPVLTRYLILTFTGPSDWYAAQLAELSAYSQ